MSLAACLMGVLDTNETFTSLALAVVGAVAGVHDVAAGDTAKVASDGAGLCLQWVGGADQLPEGGHHALALPHLRRIDGWVYPRGALRVGNMHGDVAQLPREYNMACH